MKIVFTKKEVEGIVLNYVNQMMGEGVPAFNDITLNIYSFECATVEQVEPATPAPIEVAA